MIGFAAMKWSRRPAATRTRAALPRDEKVDPQLEARLDDELRDLD